jgi:hypothetical protein
MLSIDDTHATFQRLRAHTVYMDFVKRIPILAWVVTETPKAVHLGATQTRPVEGFPGLVWALVEVMSVTKSAREYLVTFYADGSYGMYTSSSFRLHDTNVKV